MLKQPDTFAAPAVMAEVLAAFRSVLEDPTLELGVDTLLEDIQGWDSMRQITLEVELEFRFGTELDLRRMETAATVGDFVRAIGSKSAPDA
jgi:acyl carrier protein